MGVALAHTLKHRAARYLVICLPAFRLERCGYGADDLAGLLAEVKNAARLVALTPEAYDQGLRVGMTASAARALYPEVLLEELDPVGEAQDRTDLIRAFLTLSDQVSGLFEDSVVLEVHRTAHLFGGEEGVLTQARSLAERLGHHAQAAIGDDPLATWALARWNPSIVAAGEGAAALSKLPVEALRPSDGLLSALAPLGIEWIGQLARLEPASVRGRWGDEGLRLLRVARGEPASGLMIGGNVSEHPSAGLTFGFDVASLEQLMPVLPNLLEQLARQLRGRDQVAVQVLVRLVTSLRPRNIRVRPSRPSRSGERLLRLIRVRLEDMKLSSPVTEIHVEVEEVAPEPAWQPGLTDRSEMREPLPTVVDRLREALGEGTVFTAEMADRWRPEASWGQSQVLPQHGLFSTKRREVDDGDPVLQQEKLERALGRPRPLVLLPSPIPLEARIDAQGMPTSVLLDSGWVAVGDCEGPERLQGEWWEDDGGFDRDYFAVAVRNGTAWLFRDAERWFLHGWFD